MQARHARPRMPWVVLAIVVAGVAAVWLAGSVGHADQVREDAASPVTTIVSLTWDDATASQYDLAFLRAMGTHEMDGTFYINSGNVGRGPEFMSWGDVHTLADAGNDIGGHTIDHVNLVDPRLGLAQKVHQVCDDRQALIRHGFKPSNFAYPYAALDPTAEHIVIRCGYETARSGGGADPSGPVYSETIAPEYPYATRAWSPPDGEEMTLTDLQAVVQAAARHGGGWVQIVGHQVCSQVIEPDTYADCTKTYGWIDLQTLNRFLDWLQDAGAGGAPAGTIVKSVADVVGNEQHLQP
jgi:peptidoglycan/xylan/chitin deacetylase (PgdA/CDA1 family)